MIKTFILLTFAVCNGNVSTCDFSYLTLTPIYPKTLIIGNKHTGYYQNYQNCQQSELITG